MSAEENKAISRWYYEQVWNQGNTVLLDELMVFNHKHHAPLAPVLGVQEFKEYVTFYRQAFPDFHLTLEDQVAEGDKVVDRWTMRGTHRGELMGIPATGKQIVMTGISITRIAVGKLQETWADFDLLGMLQQLSLFHLAKG